MITHMTHYQKALLPQIFISLAISAWWFMFPPYWDNPFRFVSAMMFIYALQCSVFFLYYEIPFEGDCDTTFGLSPFGILRVLEESEK